MLKLCVRYKHIIASTKVQQLLTILIAFSNAVRNDDLVAGGAVRTHLSIEVKSPIMTSRSEEGIEIVSIVVGHRKHQKYQQIRK